MFEIADYNETYLITLPSLHIEGLIYGNPFVELNKCTYISSSSGYVAKIDYSGKGWVSGKKNSFVATLYPANNEKEILYTIDGQWTDSFTIREGSKKHGAAIDSYSAKTSKITPLTVAPIEQQDPMESWKAWRTTKAAILKGDMDTTSTEKSKIENSQRELRRKEQAEGREWQRRYFSRLPAADAAFDTLSKPIGEKIELEKTGGVWRFDPEKYKLQAAQASPSQQQQAPQAPQAPLRQA